jgi:hypothetical protein
VPLKSLSLFSSNIGAPFGDGPLDGNGPPASHNENYVHSWMQDTVEAHQLLLDNIVCFAMSDFGGTHDVFIGLMIMCEVRRYGLLLRTPHNIYADRTLLLQIESFVIQFSESWVFLSTNARSNELC